MDIDPQPSTSGVQIHVGESDRVIMEAHKEKVKMIVKCYLIVLLLKQM